MNTLRPYQENCVQKMLWSLTIDGNSIVSLPTGSGKSHIIAEFVHRLHKPVLILVPSKEILEQDLEKLSRVVSRDEIGIFSASMQEKTVKTYTLSTIQSAYKKPELFTHYEVVLIDECHLLNPKNLEGMYNTFFKSIGNPKVIGLTATPYRLDSYYKPTGKRWQPWETVTTTKLITRYKQLFWRNTICVINTQELMDQGFLSPLDYLDRSIIYHSDIPTNKSASDFDLEAYEEIISPREQEISKFIDTLRLAHKSILVFNTSIAQAERLQSVIKGSAIVTGTTPTKERTRVIQGIKGGQIQVVFNVGVLTTGFDHPSLDCIVCIRPTRSLNLWNQMIGRATRIAEGKTSATIYDLAGNLKSLGRLESIKVVKLEGKWNVISETKPDGFHLKPLYVYAPKPRTQKEEWLNK